MRKKKEKTTIRFSIFLYFTLDEEREKNKNKKNTN